MQHKKVHLETLFEIGEIEAWIPQGGDHKEPLLANNWEV